jgi:hypothetical protein
VPVNAPRRSRQINFGKSQFREMLVHDHLRGFNGAQVGRNAATPVTARTVQHRDAESQGYYVIRNTYELANACPVSSKYSHVASLSRNIASGVCSLPQGHTTHESQIPRIAHLVVAKTCTSQLKQLS